ncbi:MAG: HAD family hydrolase [Deltaproteobacteria bacterium]|nr:HAD family hydrolase [Deltaproteobacteria bacterium]
MNAAVFLDRDGTLIREVNYLCTVEQIEILPGVCLGLSLLREGGFKRVMVTNQSVIARGGLSEAGLQEIHAVLTAKLGAEGATLDGIYYCPHHPTEGIGEYRIACDCRKPNRGLIERAAKDLQLDVARSYVVGDQMTDVELAQRVGAVAILIGRDDDAVATARALNIPVVDDLLQAAHWIIAHAENSQSGAGLS